MKYIFISSMKRKDIKPSQELVLKKALFKAAKLWDLSNKDLASIIGSSEATISRLSSNKDKGINPKSKEGELVLLFIRIFRALDAILGNVLENEKQWLRSNNKSLNGIPLELMKTISGMVKVVNYLDSIRGKI